MVHNTAFSNHLYTNNLLLRNITTWGNLMLSKNQRYLITFNLYFHYKFFLIIYVNFRCNNSVIITIKMTKIRIDKHFHTNFF